MTKTIVAVTGGRDFSNYRLVSSTLDSLHAGGHTLGPLCRLDLIVHGGCTGADALADQWALSAHVQTCVFFVTPVQWKFFGRSSGPRRNRIMLEVTCPGLLVAFPGGAGTANCVKTARELGIEVLEITP